MRLSESLMMSRFSDADDDAGLERPLALQLGHVVERVGPVEVDDGVLLGRTVRSCCCHACYFTNHCYGERFKNLDHFVKLEKCLS